MLFLKDYSNGTNGEFIYLCELKSNKLIKSFKENKKKVYKYYIHSYIH